MNIRERKLERLRCVIGLSAAGMTYEAMTRYIGVGTRQRVQQLVAEAVERFPKLALRLDVSGRRNRRRRPKDHRREEGRAPRGIQRQRTPRPSVRARHIAMAKQLLKQHGGEFPRVTEMLRSGHGALYQFMRKYPHDFEQLKRERPVSSERVRRTHRHQRRFSTL